MSRSRASAHRDEPFGPAFNWCDGACARCALESECTLARRLRGSRWIDDFTADDGDAWDAMLADVDRSLACTIDLLTEIAEREALGGDEMPLEPPVSLYGERLRRAGLRYSTAISKLFALAREHAHGDPAVLAAHTAGMRIGPKVARLSALVCADGTMRFEPVVAWEGHANLMLIEELDRRCMATLPLLFPPDPAIVGEALMAAGRLFALLEPLQRQIPRSARRALARMVRDGRAPSPFFVTNVVPIGALTNRARAH